MSQPRNTFFRQPTKLSVDQGPINIIGFLTAVTLKLSLDSDSNFDDSLFAVCGMVTLAATGCALYNIAKHTDTFSMA